MSASINKVVLLGGAAGSGTGDVVGPASATDNAVVRFDGTTGKVIQNSAVTIADTTGSISINGTDTAIAVNTGGLRSANFGLSTVSGGASYFGGAGIFSGNVTISKAAPVASIATTGTSGAGSNVYLDSTSITSGKQWILNSAGTTETAGVGFFTLTLAGVGDALRVNPTATTVSIPATTSASSSTVGALTIGNGTAATNVAIGGGNINAGGTLTGGSTIANAGNITTTLSTASPLRFYAINGNSASVAETAYQTNADRMVTGVGGSTHATTSIRNKYYITDDLTSTVLMTVAANNSGVVVTSTTPATTSTSAALAVAGGIYAGAASVFAGQLALSSDASSLPRKLLLYDTSTGLNTQGIEFSNPTIGTAGSTAYVRAIRTASGGSDTDLSFGTMLSGVVSEVLRVKANGQTTLIGGLVTSSTTVSGAAAVPISTSLVKFTSTGAGQALSLANGTDGQCLTIVHDVDGGSGVLTPTTKTGFSTVTFTNAGDTVSLVYVTTRGWMVTGSYGVTIAP